MRDCSQRIFREAELHALVLEQLLILLDQRVLGRSQYLDHRGFIKLVKRSADGQAAYELWNQSKLDHVLRFDLRKRFAQSLLARASYVRVESESLLADAFLDDFFKPDKRASANEQYVRRIDREKLLVRMLTAALRRNVRHCPLENFQQRLLHAFTRNIASDRRVLVLATNLVDLVDVDDSVLRSLDVAVGSLQQFQNDVLDILSNVAGFCERRRIHDRERNVEHSSQRLRKQRFAGTGRADQEYVRFLNLDIARSALQHVNSLVVLINRHGQPLLGFFLTDNVVVEEFLDLHRLWERRASSGCFLLLIVADDLVANIDALIADINGRAGNQLLHFVLRFSAKRAAQCVVASSHSVSNLAKSIAMLWRLFEGKSKKVKGKSAVPVFAFFLFNFTFHSRCVIT